jgi:hypothetical protein
VGRRRRIRGYDGRLRIISETATQAFGTSDLLLQPLGRFGRPFPNKEALESFFGVEGKYKKDST